MNNLSRAAMRALIPTVIALSLAAPTTTAHASTPTEPLLDTLVIETTGLIALETPPVMTEVIDSVTSERGKKGSKSKKGGKKNKNGSKGKKNPPRAVSFRERAIQIAAAQSGDPYVYGAAGPNAFDCSGLTSFAFRGAGHSIPRTSSAQRAATPRIPASARQRGDLVFFHNSSGVYHVGIYVGDNAVIHAPSTGTKVHRANIWTSSVSYGRVN